MIHKTGRGRRILVAVLTGILVVMAVLAFLFRDKLNAETLRQVTGREEPLWTGGEAFSYESGGSQVFALAGDGLAAASVTGLQLLDADGRMVAREIFSMDVPALAVSPVHCAFFDVGGTALRVAAPDGTVTELDTGERIISVTVNRKGYLAVATEEQGYKGCVTVRSPELTALYRWHAGTGYILSARVTPDGGGLVVNCLTETGGELRFFSLSSEEQQAVYAAQSVILDFDFLDNGLIAAICEEKLALVDEQGAETALYDYSGLHLTDYVFSDDMVTLHLSHYRSGSAGMLVNVDDEGQPLGTADLREGLQSLSVNDGELLTLQPGTLTLYNASLEVREVRSCPAGVRQALLRGGGEALLLSGYGAELYRL